MRHERAAFIKRTWVLPKTKKETDTSSSVIAIWTKGHEKYEIQFLIVCHIRLLIIVIKRSRTYFVGYKGRTKAESTKEMRVRPTETEYKTSCKRKNAKTWAEKKAEERKKEGWKKAK